MQPERRITLASSADRACLDTQSIFNPYYIIFTHNITLSLLNLALASLFLSPVGSCATYASLPGGSLLLATAWLPGAIWCSSSALAL